MHARPVGTPGLVAEHRVPLTTVEFSGRRYVALANLGLPKRIPLMVHGNGRLYLSLVHAVAEQLVGRPIERLDDYGYTARGKGMIDVPTLRLAGAVFDGVTGVPVFDFTEDPDAPVEGMLGTRFLSAARAAVDFTTDSLLLGVPVADRPNRTLVELGYRTIAMAAHADGRMTIDVRFPAIDRVVAITPSTVGNALTLHRPVFLGRVAMAPSIPDRSPSGTSPDVFTSEGVDFDIAGVACRNAASFEDLAEYANVPKERLQSYGMLGYDWMKQHSAVIDYANQILYFDS